MTVESIIVIVAALLAGAVSKAITGFGLPLVSIPVMAAFLGVETSVVVMVAPVVYSNLVLLREFRGAPAVRGLGRAIAVGFAGIALGTWLLETLDPGVLALVLAAWIGFYLVGQLTRVDLFGRVSRHGRLLVGAVGLGGICQGATGIAGPIIVPAMHAMRLERSQMVFAMAAVFGAYGVAQAVAMGIFGLFTKERLLLSLVATVPVVIGLPIGLWLGRRISAPAFNRCVLALLAIMGLKLAHDGAAALGW